MGERNSGNEKGFKKKEVEDEWCGVVVKETMVKNISMNACICG